MSGSLHPNLVPRPASIIVQSCMHIVICYAACHGAEVKQVQVAFCGDGTGKSVYITCSPVRRTSQSVETRFWGKSVGTEAKLEDGCTDDGL